MHYFTHINVAVLNLKDSLKFGDMIHFLGHITDFSQRVASMEVEHQTVIWVKPGEDVAIKIVEPVREHDIVYKVIEAAVEAVV